MKIAAAFYWDSSSKYIATMLLDPEMGVPHGPNKMVCGDPNWARFTANVSNAVNGFFAEVDKEIQLGRKVTVIFKIVSPAGPITHYGHSTGPGKHSKFVDDVFRANLTSRSVKSHRVRSTLKKKVLDEFEAGLVLAGVMSKKKTDAFKHRIWSVALKATKKTAHEKAMRVWSALTSFAGTTKDARTAFQQAVQHELAKKKKK